MKTTEGNKFGGYASIPWNNNGTSKDNNSFTFSLNKMKKYNILKPEKAIQTSNSYFAFGEGNSYIYIKNNCHSTNDNYCDDYDKIYSATERHELNGGKKNFTVSSYEVYQIE